MIYKYTESAPRWINFENKSAVKGGGGVENRGAKGHAWEHFLNGEEKILCDLHASGIVRRIWFTLSNRSQNALKNVIIKMLWDDAETPQVEAPIGDFFCMGSGKMKAFENEYFSTAEGRSFSCYIPMPFKRHCKIVLCNNTGADINNLFYDINVTLEDVNNDDMYFHALYREIKPNKLCEDVEILPKTFGIGRFLGANIAVTPDKDQYKDTWWGEGEVKIFIDGDGEYPTLVGTGAEDYIGSAWELGEFINRYQGCVTKDESSVSMYRFHVKDPICFQKDISVRLQAMGGGFYDKVKKVIDNGGKYALVSYDDGDLHGIYKADFEGELRGYVNFFREDSYATVAYYYLKEDQNV